MSNNRRYSMKEGVSIANQASQDIEKWLRKLKNTTSVKNVEDNDYYQNKDIDLIWKTKKSEYMIEIKGDRWHKTGNLFFETKSNKEKGTPGCFMYTEADLLFYYFVEPKDLYILPMPETRKWFIDKIDEFEKRATTTPVNDNYYTTVGRLVPIKKVLEEISDIKKYNLKVK